MVRDMFEWRSGRLSEGLAPESLAPLSALFSAPFSAPVCPLQKPALLCRLAPGQASIKGARAFL
jgi:hypothetical protein